MVHGRYRLVSTIGEGGITEADLMVHDETDANLASLLGRMDVPEFPVPVGVIYCNPQPSYERLAHDQMDQAMAKADGKADMNALLRRGYTWTVQ